MILIADKAKLEQFASAVLDLLDGSKAHQRTGNRDGEQSLSHVKSELRFKGWKIGGHDSDLEDTLKAAGFSIRRTGAPQYRTYIGV